MIQVTVTEAQQRLPELLALAQSGESVEIRPDSGRSCVLIDLLKHENGNEGWAGYPKAGSCKGKIWMSDDFDAPLEELREHME